MLKEHIELTGFAKDILKGLQACNKSLPSKYFYDTKGDGLFQQIMHLEEYYLFRKELEIFKMHKEAILNAVYDGNPFRIIELGVGDGLKTTVLLKYFFDQGIDFTYTPVDISGSILEILERNLSWKIPGIKIKPYEGIYSDALAEISKYSGKDVVFFLGSNIGNFSQNETEGFLTTLHNFLTPGDLLFMGVDLKKDPSIILNAYNDAKGMTREFNMNLLNRINEELNGNVNTQQFLHYPYYDPNTGECRSYLISKIEQVATIGGEKIHFRAWEAILMEISKKYDQPQLEFLAQVTGFKPLTSFFDTEKWFANVLWKKDKHI